MNVNRWLKFDINVYNSVRWTDYSVVMTDDVSLREPFILFDTDAVQHIFSKP